MENTSVVSIVIPSYNVEKYIERGILSCLQQTYQNIEVIIVDDGSTDQTTDIIEKYAILDRRIKLIRKRNGGVSSARNVGLKNISGDYVIFLDSDDWLEINAIEKLLLLQKEYPDSFILTDLFIVYHDKNGKEKRVFRGKGRTFSQASREEALENVGTSRYALVSACYKLFDTTIIRECNLLFDETLYHGEDGLFVFEYLKHVNKIAYSPIALWDILEREGSATTAGYNKKMLTAHVSIDKMLKLPGNSDRVIVALQKYKLRRIESVMSLAIRAGIKENYSDLEFLRNALKETAESSNVILSKNEMANYMIFSSCPYQTIKAIDKMKSVIKGCIKKTYYSLFKRA